MSPNSTMRVEANEAGLAFEGALDRRSVPKLLRTVERIEVKSSHIDLSRVSSIDSAGLAFLVYWGNQHGGRARKIRLQGASDQAKKLISIMGLNTVFELI